MGNCLLIITQGFITKTNGTSEFRRSLLEKAVCSSCAGVRELLGAVWEAIARGLVKAQQTEKT
jgi:hypothetical protein